MSKNNVVGDYQIQVYNKVVGASFDVLVPATKIKDYNSGDFELLTANLIGYHQYGVRLSLVDKIKKIWYVLRLARPK